MTTEPHDDGGTSVTTSEADEGKPTEEHGWLRRRFVKRFSTVPPKPPDDAELPETKRWRESRSVVVRCLVDYANPVPWDPPERFPQSLEELRERLSTDDADLADELLADAQQLYAEADARVDSAESRATTLQGTVAIAATVALAGAGLVLDPSKVHGGHWRTYFAIGLALLVLLLVLTALKATSAAARTFEFTTPSDDGIFERAKLSTAAQAKTQRAAYLLHGYGRNNEVAAIKVGYLRSAAFWFRGVLAMLLVLTALVCIYVADGAGSKTSAVKVTQQSSKPAPSVRKVAPPARSRAHRRAKRHRLRK
jgi:hypothetical protein